MNRMKFRYLFSIVFVAFLITSFILPNKSLATSWAYPFVVWDGYIYVVTDEYVTEIDRKIGKVTKYSDMERLSGNFSNAYKKGTKYYSIKGVSTDEAIAIQEKNGMYKKAIREAKDTYKGDDRGLPVQVFLVLFLITFIGIFFIKKKV
ncbi:hypothetical protein DS745_03515 [Anaerobacillus alkaliphilus]|uniref:Uncharacterized protein n=1 Tax=Anaerobacillus alkaliphilus TaxID=1548597 RepID=A0A4V1LGZ6_9BACI|nr:hypothetical protein [Anaerobacillus alkaliphilus]RXJ04465.1 hypothetical protein DS745_03515 [Anaerobacillus alkaliphilus]